MNATTNTTEIKMGYVITSKWNGLVTYLDRNFDTRSVLTKGCVWKTRGGAERALARMAKIYPGKAVHYSVETV